MGRPDAAAIGRASPTEGGAGASGPVPETLRREFEELGLTPYESRVLLALLSLGSTNTLRLARASGVPRTSTYQVLEDLRIKRLAERLPGDGPALWASPSSDEVLDRLDAAHEERLRQHRLRSERVRQMLAEHIPESPVVALPYVHLIFGMSDVKSNYERLLGEAEEEVLVFNRPPYSWKPENVNALVVRLAGRLATRVLYQAPQVEDPGADSFRRAMEAYHAAGVEGRVVDDLPIKLAVFDRRVALITLVDPAPIEVGFPTALLIEHAGLAALQADAFEHRWGTARSYPSLREERDLTDSA